MHFFERAGLGRYPMVSLKGIGGDIVFCTGKQLLCLWPFSSIHLTDLLMNQLTLLKLR